MPRVKQVEDVAILEWGAGDPPSLVGELRTLVEGGATKRVLLDLTGFDSLRADGLESLTEAFTVCEDRGCAIGLFGTNDTFNRIVELMDLAGDLPPVLGKAEGEAVASLKGRAAGSNGKAHAPAAKPPAQTRPSAAPATRTVEVELDLGAATAPTARFDASQVAAVSFGARSAAAAPPPAGAQPDEDLLGIDWAPLVATGYQIGGNNVARVGPVSPSAATPAPPAPSTPRPRPQEDEGVIDLGEVTPARVPAPRGGAGAAFRKTEVLPAFVDVDERSGAAAASVLGQRDEGDFSPLDAGPSGPPAGVLARGAAGPASLPPPASRPAAERKSERFAPPSRRPGSGSTPAAAPTQAPAPVAAQRPAPAYAPPPAAPANNAYSGGGGAGYESDEQTVMFTPGALDAAMLAAAAGDVGGAAAPEEAPQATASPTAPMGDGGAGSDEEETVMFQPGALDAELLAQVAAAVGPASVVAPPAVEQPPAPAQPAMSDAPDARDLELRLFMHDHALSSPVHLQVLERLARTSDQAFGRSELQLATGAALGVISGVIDQLVAARLLRRTRAPRARGGVGFVLSMSPASRNVLGRLLKSWQAPSTRARVAAWFEGQ
jgi:hypothetical protein